MFSLLDAAVFKCCSRAWIAGIVNLVQGAMTLDGKTLRGQRGGQNTALHVVSAFCQMDGMVQVGHLKTDSKRRMRCVIHRNPGFIGSPGRGRPHPLKKLTTFA
ncbi:hypothetical protein [Polaromonas sp. CG_9.11]|uniref:hypothetical protein n=1 Tax=Polaromonas sp. CG_9.11 TaxID=2787730 RepID=UPI001A245B39|nr:hypothetical protein [Polaromonas sp. CG_9.11]MBG6077281.1 hypothetical protein [Polaromonas sp. CG_9.11]